MKVLFISNLLYRFGPPIAFYRLIKDLTETNKYSIDLISFADGPLKESYEKIGINPRIETLHEQSIENIMRLKSIINSNKYDVIICNTLDSINGIFAANILGLPSVLYIHEDWPQVNASIFHYFAFNLADTVILTSPFQKKAYSPILDKKNTSTIENGIPFDIFDKDKLDNKQDSIKQANGFPLDKKIISIVGTVCDRKRQDLFIFAACELLKKRNDLLFLIVGWFRPEEHYYRLLKKYIEAAGFSDKILFLGDKPDIENYIAVSDIIVCPSTNDVAPQVILEAQALGKPCIISSIESMKGIITDGLTGKIFTANNQSLLEDSIISILNNYDTYKNNSIKRMGIIKKTNDIKISAMKLKSILNKLKFKKKPFSVRISNNKMLFNSKKGISLAYKHMSPLIQRKPSSAIR